MVMRQSIMNHVRASGFTLITTFIFILIWWYLNFDEDFLVVVGLFQLIFTLPAVYIHVSYTLRNFGEEIEIKHDSIVVNKHGHQKLYSKDDLVQITLFKPASLDNGGIPLSAMDYYKYARISTKIGDEIIISCLMSVDFENYLRELKGIPFKRKTGLALLIRK